SRLTVRRNPAAALGDRALVLDGQDLALRSVSLDGRLLPPGAYDLGPESLTVPDVPDRTFTLETVSETKPRENTSLQGLYVSGGMFCTQCEAEGFRKITWFPDRPDVMAR